MKHALIARTGSEICLHPAFPELPEAAPAEPKVPDLLCRFIIGRFAPSMKLRLHLDQSSAADRARARARQNLTLFTAADLRKHRLPVDNLHTPARRR